MADILLLDNVDSFTYSTATSFSCSRPSGGGDLPQRVPAEVILSALETIKPVLVLSRGRKNRQMPDVSQEVLSRVRGRYGGRYFASAIQAIVGNLRQQSQITPVLCSTVKPASLHHDERVHVFRSCGTR